MTETTFVGGGGFRVRVPEPEAPAAAPAETSATTTETPASTSPRSLRRLAKCSVKSKKGSMLNADDEEVPPEGDCDGCAKRPA